MLKAQRQEQIVRRLAQEGTESVGSIASALGVSEMTIRRDLEELSERKMVERVYGGARLPRTLADTFGADGIPVPREYSHAEKRHLHMEEKRRIAQRAVRLIDAHDTIFLGAGTTAEQMADCLPAVPLRIVTNSLSIFKRLEHDANVELYLVGGLYRRQTGCFVGGMAEDAVAPLGIDKAFIGTNGVATGSLFTADIDEGRLQRLVLDKAHRRYAIADASKIGRRDFYAFFRLIDLCALICSGEIDPAHRAEIEQQVDIIEA
ncbi:DeoR/GlpR family DNA-binding transcription regulator [Collinsella tanakaei]|uniref:DeoR/GlpR family DNA-binding transcription regulator n=1 Tax=Collinsella tanakaei TaxID=626935 RepID=UPI0025A41F38|nr:DeoR/GlpR family DNA-binding transcription regulator [Collinsella tanakaei]MDM8300672.1 DeoR/GlpR family DNA-binding transcription regulator [Collinsella tanakaei]